jgi:RNA polymerase sigma factor (sigma-70 family)
VTASAQPVPEEAATAFDRHRRLLFTVAYQMLGSVADAEDTVQDAWLRWSSAPRDDVADPKAYLVRVVSRLALDRLNSARARRETSVGPWLPEPLLTDRADAATDPAEAAEIGEQVSLALLVVLETLSPLERAVFVLRDVFGLSAAEVAAVLDRSEASVRQTAHRAREHVEARRPRFDADRVTQRAVTERFFAAVAGGDVDELMAVLSPGVVLVSDGGGQASAALRPRHRAEGPARLPRPTDRARGRQRRAVAGGLDRRGAVRSDLAGGDRRPGRRGLRDGEPGQDGWPHGAAVRHLGSGG